MPSESTDVRRDDGRPLVWVTGATSFLGRHVALTLSNLGFDVIGFARGRLDPDQMKRWGFVSVECGAFAEPLLRRAFERAGAPTAVFHAIGAGSVGQAHADPMADAKRTLATTKLLLKHIFEIAPRARVIYPSSAAVYGDAPAGPIGEGSPTAPVSIYGEHKLRAEDLCHSHSQRTGQTTVIVRFFSVYGAPQRKLLLWDIGQRLLAGESSMTLGGTGQETRDFIHVSDAALIIAKIVSNTSPPLLLNAGTGRATSVKTLVELLAAGMDLMADFQFDGRSRAGNPLHQQADVSLLRKLGFAPAVSLEQGVADYANWLRTGQV